MYGGFFFSKTLAQGCSGPGVGGLNVPAPNYFYHLARSSARSQGQRLCRPWAPSRKLQPWPLSDSYTASQPASNVIAGNDNGVFNPPYQVSLDVATIEITEMSSKRCCGQMRLGAGRQATASLLSPKTTNSCGCALKSSLLG